MIVRSPLRSLTTLLAAGLLTLGAGSVSAEGDNPGAENPIGSPNNLTIFSVDDIGMLASSGSVANSTLIDFAANNARLTQWSQSGQQLHSNDLCVTTPRRRLIAGRVSTPKYEQPLCVTAFGLSLYPGERGMAKGEFLSYAFADPGIGSSARDFDAAAGLLNWSADKNELLHMSVAVARRNLSNRLAVEIIGYRPADTVQQEPALVSLAQWSDSSDQAVTGDVAVALGDYDNNGELELLAAADVTTGEGGPGRLLLRSFDYDAESRTLTPRGSYTVETTARPHSIDLAAGDFASLGFDQAILGYFTEGATNSVQVALFRLGAELQISAPSPVQKLTAAPASSSFFEIEAGLFYFDPANSQGSDPSFAFHTRQLALAWAESDGSVKAQIIRTSPEMTQFLVSSPQKLSDNAQPSRTDGVGPALGTGNFIGLQDDNVSPLDQLAVVIPTYSTATPTASIPQLVVSTVNYAPTTGQFSIQPVWSDQQPIYESSGLQYSPGVVGLDSRGLSFFLGTPAHIRIQDLIDPQYVIYMPPRHADCLLMQPGDTSCTMVNISANTNFAVKLVDSTQETLQQTSTDQMNTSFGSDASLSVGGTVGGGFMQIAKMEVSTNVKTTFSYQQEVMEKTTNSQYQSMLTQNSATTSMDDHLIWNARNIDVWRYPIYSLNMNVPDAYPYYDVLIPGKLLPYSAGGRSVDWFSPKHMNNNVLSYPEIADPAFPDDLGSFTYDDAQGNPVTMQQPFNAGVVRSFDGNAQTFELSYTSEVGGSTQKNFSYNLSNSTDISVGFKASADIKIVDVSSETKGTISLNSRSSWEQSELASRSVKNSRGITLTQPSVAGAEDKSYNYQTLIYVSNNGGLKVAHAVDPLGTQGGRGWWKSTYGGRPDPALNLPNRIILNQSNGQWILNPGESYSEMRGITLTSNSYDEETKSYPNLTGGVEEGTAVRVVVKLYNLSVDTVAYGVKVHFAYQALNPSDLTPLGAPVIFATSQPLDLPIKQVSEIAEVWDTSGLAGFAGTPYRFVITLDTGGMDEIHGSDPATGGNDMGVWPWSGSYFYVFKSGTESRLATAATPSAQPRLAVALSAATTGARSAEITLEHDRDDPTMRRLLVLQQPAGEAGPTEVLASRTLWGIYRGKRQLHIPLPELSGPAESLRVVLTSGEQ